MQRFIVPESRIPTHGSRSALLPRPLWERVGRGGSDFANGNLETDGRQTRVVFHATSSNFGALPTPSPLVAVGRGEGAQALLYKSADFRPKQPSVFLHYRHPSDSHSRAAYEWGRSQRPIAAWCASGECKRPPRW